jgi:glycyl-tRNA synthetase
VAILEKNYRRHDEVGTPVCITIDFETLEENTVTIRDRDTMKQRRISETKLEEEFKKLF